MNIGSKENKTILELKNEFRNAVADKRPDYLHGHNKDDTILIFMIEIVNLLKSINGNIEANTALLESIDRSIYEK